ncbi:MAG: hypothetical protein LBV10_20925 [Stenotrophomonas sp.]|jgi:hypothetical protein|uniref:hypothetical protein n=1 Tax=Stenotrophomonas sp. TaxID=69392 RepID=UPI00283C24A6|nr:hypothetical protein [Stenotrophomonas sp.]MDR2961994.1 hypothetical protein [Stenotrophomonas sp.]
MQARILKVVALILLCSFTSWAGAQTASNSTAFSQKLNVPMPLNTQACGGSCIEYVAAGHNSFIVARDPQTGNVFKTFPVDLPAGSSFGPGTITMSLQADATPAGAIAAPIKPNYVGGGGGGGVPNPPPSGNGPVTVTVPIYGADASIVAYQVTTYIFTGGVVTNISSVTVTVRPK